MCKKKEPELTEKETRLTQLDTELTEKKEEVKNYKNQNNWELDYYYRIVDINKRTEESIINYNKTINKKNNNGKYIFIFALTVVFCIAIYFISVEYFDYKEKNSRVIENIEKTVNDLVEKDKK